MRNKSALLVQSDGDGKIVETPADPPFLSTQHVEIDAQVSDLGKLTAKLRYFLRGDNEVALRLAFRRTPPNEWPQLGQTIAALDGIHGNVTSVKPSDPTDTENPFELDLDYEQPGYLDWAKKKTKVPVPLLSLGMPHSPDNPADPIHLGSPLNITTSLKLTPAGEFHRAQTPVGVSVARDYADVQIRLRLRKSRFYRRAHPEFQDARASRLPAPAITTLSPAPSNPTKTNSSSSKIIPPAFPKFPPPPRPKT